MTVEATHVHKGMEMPKVGKEPSYILCTEPLYCLNVKSGGNKSATSDGEWLTFIAH